MTVTTRTMAEIEALRREQRALERDLDESPPCPPWHGVGKFPRDCHRCFAYERCDEIDHAIGRLLRYGGES